MLKKGKLYKTYNSQAYYYCKNKRIWVPIKRNSIYIYLGYKTFFVNFITTDKIIFYIARTTKTGNFWLKCNKWTTVFELSKEFIEIK